MKKYFSFVGWFSLIVFIIASIVYFIVSVIAGIRLLNYGGITFWQFLYSIILPFIAMAIFGPALSLLFISYSERMEEPVKYEKSLPIEEVVVQSTARKFNVDDSDINLMEYSLKNPQEKHYRLSEIGLTGTMIIFGGSEYNMTLVKDVAMNTVKQTISMKIGDNKYVIHFKIEHLNEAMSVFETLK